jgi:hypothetical protein
VQSPPPGTCRSGGEHDFDGTAQFSQRAQIPAQNGVQAPAANLDQMKGRYRRIASINGGGAPVGAKLSYKKLVVPGQQLPLGENLHSLRPCRMAIIAAKRFANLHT